MSTPPSTDGHPNVALVIQNRSRVQLDGVRASRYVVADRIPRLRLRQQFRESNWLQIVGRAISGGERFAGGQNPGARNLP